MNFPLYRTFIMSAIKVQMAYIGTFWSGFFSNILWLIVSYSFWVAAYQETTDIKGYSIGEMITYILIATTLGKYVSGMTGMLASTIRDGSIAMELMRPYHPLMKYGSWDMGNKISLFIKETIPAFIIVALFLPFQWANLETTLYFLLSAILGVYIGILLDLMIDMLSFWLVDLWGVYLLKGAIMMFLSGALIPLTLFPDWLQKVGSFLPFSSMVFVPASIYTGKLSGEAMWVAIGIQFMWLIGIVLVLASSWKFITRRVSVFGG